MLLGRPESGATVHARVHLRVPPSPLYAHSLTTDLIVRITLPLYKAFEWSKTKFVGVQGGEHFSLFIAFFVLFRTFVVLLCLGMHVHR